MSYLYGASVQGIQNFIFETNKLKEIAGASELVEQIATTMFKRIVPDFNVNQLIVGAAGNIKYIFDKKGDCEEVVKEFPKAILSLAPKITISQAVVAMDGDLKYDDIISLEKKLIIQRKKLFSRKEMGLMVSERARRTAGAGTHRVQYGKDAAPDKELFVADTGQYSKIIYDADGKEHLLLKKVLGQRDTLQVDDFTTDITEIIKEKSNQWLAIVHADGNNLGKMIQQMAQKLKDGNKSIQEAFRTFSAKLEEATIAAVQDAFYTTIIQKLGQNYKIPMRPVIIGGDDITVIIRGDFAMDFTERYLKAFQEQTKEKLATLVREYDLNDFNEGLTACAGIAYIKPKYPFHYGVDLAENLCSHSKKVAKALKTNNVPACLTFHKVHSSFVTDYPEMVATELTAQNPSKTVCFNYGPYFLENHHNYATIEQLKGWVRELDKADAPDAPLREWLASLHENQGIADQLLQRICNINSKSTTAKLKLKSAILERDTIKTLQGKETKKEYVTHIFDAIALANIESKK